tara:strand:+ start:493 stop:615 length:123 start_codon:yes stop_codon:yes gene_type:complete
MNINVRYCKKCKKAYDIGTNLDICPECRRKKKRRENGRTF